jgi:hypothetical protein
MFPQKEKSLAPTEIPNPEFPAHSLVAILTELLLTDRFNSLSDIQALVAVLNTALAFAKLQRTTYENV